MMIKKQNYLKHAIVLFLLLLLMQPGRAWAAYENVEFSSLTNHDGLTNSQVGAILKDTRGYIWFGTQSGLCRFDGFRMKTFYYSNTDDKSLPNNSVDELQQDYDGNIWVHTSMGYSIYKYDEEQFDRKSEEWLKNIHVQGPPYKLLIDKDKNMWIAVYGQGLYLSIWAFIVYIILIGVAFYLYRKRMLEKQRVKFELQSKEDSCMVNALSL
jgi:hypothetical protein